MIADKFLNALPLYDKRNYKSNINYWLQVYIYVSKQLIFLEDLEKFQS